MKKIRLLNDLAHERGQSLAQMALAWVLRKEQVTSVLIGTSRTEQLKENLSTLKNLTFTEKELTRIEKVLA